MSDQRIEEHFRSEIQTAWAAVVAARANPAAYAEALDQYCRLLFASDRYAREGRLRGKVFAAGQ